MITEDAATPVVGRLKKRTRLLLAGIVVAVAGLAIAASAGKYYCPECTFDEPAAFGDTDVFIRSEVNKHVNSWVDSKGNPLDVTICNGSQCATYLYVKLSSVFLLKSKENSNWKGDSGGGGGGIGWDWGGPGNGNPWQDCFSGVKTGTACTSAGGGVEHCVETSVPVLECPGMG